MAPRQPAPQDTLTASELRRIWDAAPDCHDGDHGPHTSATAAFTSADVGRMVIVAGAGTSGADPVSTIATVTNATDVVVADAAGTTGSAANLRIGR